MTRRPTSPTGASGPRCRDCAALDPARRTFLRSLTATIGGALLSLGATPAEAAAATLGRVGARAVGAGGLLSYPLPDADGVEVDREHEVIIARHDGAVSAFALSCPHQRSMLKWRATEQRFQCTKHKSKYAPDGTYQSGRATRNMDRHPVTLRDGSLLVDHRIVLKSDEQPAAWASAVVRPSA